MIIEKGGTPTIVFLLVDAEDYSTPVTEAQPSVAVSKNGGEFAPASGTAEEIGFGWYRIVLTAEETDTDGPLILRAYAEGTSEWRDIMQVYSNFMAVLMEEMFDRVADHVLRRHFSAAATSAHGDEKTFRSLLGAVAKDVNRVELSGSVLSIFEADDATVLGTQTVVANANPAQIVGIDTDESTAQP